MAVEFQVTTDLAKLAAVSIEANFEEAKAGLLEMMAPYQKLVVTADGIAEAKSDLAKIRKIKKRISEQRIEIKRAYLQPYDTFEAKVKDLAVILEQAESNLSGQIAHYDEARQDEKRGELLRYFTEQAANVADALRFEDVENPKWGNATYPIETAKEEIDAAVVRTQDDLAAIRQMQSEFEPALLDYYRQSRSLAAVIARNAAYLTQKQAAEERRRAEAVAAESGGRAMPAPTGAVQGGTLTAGAVRAFPTDGSASEERREVPAPAPAGMVVIDFRVTTTREKLGLLASFLRENEIQYGRVPKGAYAG